MHSLKVTLLGHPFELGTHLSSYVLSYKKMQDV